MDANVANGSLPWYRTLNRAQWRVLIASNLAWLFDGFEIYALFLTFGFWGVATFVPTTRSAASRERCSIMQCASC